MGDFPRQSEVFGNTCRDKCCARGKTRADVTPVPLYNRVVHFTMARVASAFGAERRVCRGVGAGFREDVASISKSVSPAAQVEVLVFGEAAEAPAGPHESTHVFTDASYLDVGPGGKRVVSAGASLARSFGDVFGNVGGYGVVAGSVAVGP